MYDAYAMRIMMQVVIHQLIDLAAIYIFLISSWYIIFRNIGTLIADFYTIF